MRKVDFIIVGFVLAFCLLVVLAVRGDVFSPIDPGGFMNPINPWNKYSPISPWNKNNPGSIYYEEDKAPSAVTGPVANELPPSVPDPSKNELVGIISLGLLTAFVLVALYLIVANKRLSQVEKQSESDQDRICERCGTELRRKE